MGMPSWYEEQLPLTYWWNPGLYCTAGDFPPWIFSISCGSAPQVWPHPEPRAVTECRLFLQRISTEISPSPLFEDADPSCCILLLLSIFLFITCLVPYKYFCTRITASTKCSQRVQKGVLLKAATRWGTVSIVQCKALL